MKPKTIVYKNPKQLKPNHVYCIYENGTAKVITPEQMEKGKKYSELPMVAGGSSTPNFSKLLRVNMPLCEKHLSEHNTEFIVNCCSGFKFIAVPIPRAIEQCRECNSELFMGLQGIYLSSADLSFADLSFADLRSANLSSADLRSANLSSADLSFADLRSADLSFADLSFADLRSANLSSANLRSADLSFADLSFADLRSANLSSANLRSANLRSANLSSANLRSANLSSANLSSANWLNLAHIYPSTNFKLAILTEEQKKIVKEKEGML